MVCFLVAIDDSKNSKSAFFATLGMFRRERNDKLILLTVIDDLPIIAAEATNYGIANPHLTESLDLLRNHAKTMLKRCLEVCKSFEVDATAVLGTSTDVGEAICKICKERNVDILVIGRRGISNIYRMVIGSTSKYCVENAPCTCLVVKEDWNPLQCEKYLKELIRVEDIPSELLNTTPEETCALKV